MSKFDDYQTKMDDRDCLVESLGTLGHKPVLAKDQVAGRVGETPVAWWPAGSVWPKPELVFRGGRGSVPESLVGSTRYARNWSFAARTISAPITPIKSARKSV